MQGEIIKNKESNKECKDKEAIKKTMDKMKEELKKTRSYGCV